MTALRTIFLSILILIGIDSFGQNSISGKIIDDKLQPFIGAIVINKSTNSKVYSNKDGLYRIQCNIGDTIVFDCVGYTAETRIVKDIDSRIYVILMDKSVNCLGSPWTARQYRKAGRLMNKKYKDLYKQADKKGIWKN